MRLDRALRSAHDSINFFRPTWMGEAPRASGCRPGKGKKPRLSRDGNVIKTPRFDITVTKDKVSIRDRECGAYVEAWGDPHLWTGDGDKFMFTQDNLTLDLPDGTKLTIEPTAVQGGVSWVEKLHVMNGDNVISVEGIHSAAEPVFGELGFDAADVDAAVEDGIVLYAERSIDDLFSRQTGEELIHTSGERLLDGLRGESNTDLWNSAVEPALGSTKGMDIYTRLFIVMSRLQKALESKVDKLEEIGKLRAEQKNKGKHKGRDFDTEIQKLQFEIQQLSQMMQQFSQLMTNLSKNDHEMKMAAVRNLRA